jgi:hypothetical protein
VLDSPNDSADTLRLFDLALDGVEQRQAGELIFDVFLVVSHGSSPFVVCCFTPAEERFRPKFERNLCQFYANRE